MYAQLNCCCSYRAHFPRTSVCLWLLDIFIYPDSNSEMNFLWEALVALEYLGMSLLCIYTRVVCTFPDISVQHLYCKYLLLCLFSQLNLYLLEDDTNAFPTIGALILA